jgi:AAA15 family ATPase/GTPase
MITSLHIKNFKCFEDLRVEPFYGVNLILGVNETGKTSLMKAIYAVRLAFQQAKTQNTQTGDPNLATSAFLGMIFKTFNLENKSKNQLFNDVSKQFEITVTDEIELGIIMLQNNSNYIALGTKPPINNELTLNLANAIFLPAKEVMSQYREIQYCAEKLVSTGYDLTYIYAAQALRRSEVGAKKISVGVDVVYAFDKIFDSKVRYSEEYTDFVMTVNGKDLTTPSIAEGIRKTSTIANLLNADEIQPGDVLFIDEPENNLHPRAQRAFMEALVKLSQAGVQVFMASHSYTVLKQLEIIAKRDKIDVGCYSLRCIQFTGTDARK